MSIVTERTPEELSTDPANTLNDSGVTASLLERIIAPTTASEAELVRHDLDEMQRDPAAHLTSAVHRLLIEGASSNDTQIAFEHLTRCEWCRDTLHDALVLSGSPPDNKAAVILERAHEWSAWNRVGQQATENARRELHDKGVGFVYGRDGKVFEEMPDGSERQISPILKETGEGGV